MNQVPTEVLTVTREATSSIEVTRSPKGEYSWKIKLYLDGSDVEDHTQVLGSIYEIDEQLRDQYLGPRSAEPSGGQ